MLRMHFHVFVLGIAVAVCSACSPEPNPPTAEHTDERTAPAEIPLPVTTADVTPIGDSGGVETYSALFNISRGYRLVFERSNLELTLGTLRYRDSVDGRIFGPVQDLILGRRPVYAAPSAIEIGDRAFLYYAAADSLQAPLSLERSELRGDVFGEAESLSAPPMTLRSWPRFLACGNGALALVYREGTARLVVSNDALFFESPDTITAEHIAQPHVGRFGDGTLIFAYQCEGIEEPMLSWFTIQEEAGVWSGPRLTSTASSNVHDCAFLTRGDGDVDAYYIYPAGSHGFSLFRRAISRTGEIGPEQRLTDDSVGDATKPMAARLENGSILLTFARTLERAPQGWITSQQLFAMILQGDAPRNCGPAEVKNAQGRY